jgi:hypothetical protein
LFDAYSNGYGLFAGRAKKAADSQKDFNKEVNEAKAGAISTGAELKILIGIAGDATQTDLVRNNALKQVNETTQKYGINITQASIATGEATKQVQALTNALIAQAVAAKLADKVAELIIRQSDAISNYSKATKELTKAQQEYTTGGLNAQQAAGGFAAAGTQVTSTSKNLAAALKGAEKATTEYKDVTKELQTVSVLLNQETAKGLQIINQTGGATNKLSDSQNKLNDEKKESIELIRRETQGLIALTTLGEKIIKDREKADQLSRTIRQVPGETGIISTTGRGPAQAAIEASAAFLATTNQNLTEFNQRVGFAADGLTNLFSGAFQALSEGQSPIDAITQSLKGLIVRLATAAATAGVLSLILGGITGGAGSAGGFGAIFKGLLGLGGGLKLAAGGIASRPTPALIGDGGPEAVIPLSQLANMIGGVAMQIAGNSGGGLSIVRGQDIYYSNNNASRSFGRLFG